jgi:ATP-binding cassette subfamily C protein LapB
LSGGQRQLVAFTRLILAQPRVLLLDEPTASMDDAQERRCLGVLNEELSPERTLVIVTHKRAVLSLVSRLIVVTGNRIVMDGSRDEVLAHLARPPAEVAAFPAAANEPPRKGAASNELRPAQVAAAGTLGGS